MVRPVLTCILGVVVAAAASGCSGSGGSATSSLPVSVPAASAGAFQPPTEAKAVRATASTGAGIIGLSDDFSKDVVGAAAAGWNVVTGTWSICLDNAVQSYCKTSKDIGESLNGATYWSDYTVDALVTDPVVAQSSVAVMGHVQSANTFYWLVLKAQQNGTAPYWYLEKDNGGTWTTLAGGPLQAPDANPTYRLNLAFVGSQITASIAFDGGTAYQVLGTVTDTSIPAGQVGVRMGTTISARLQKIVVTLPAIVLPAESAIESSTFVDSLGANAHFEAPNYSNLSAVRSLIGNLGIRHYRVSAAQILVNGGSYAATLTNLYNSYGTKFDVLSSLNLPAAQIVSALKLLPLASIDAVEGPNESDDPNSGAGYDPNFATSIPVYMQALHAAVKSAPGMSQIAVVGPSFSNSASYSAIGNISQNVDNGNMHDYLASFNPGTVGWGTGGYGSIDWNIGISAAASGSKPVVATETGYYTAAVHGGLPLSVQAKYVPRLFLEQYRHNVPRTFLYQLIGYDTTTTNGTLAIVSPAYVPSPAYNALAAMISELADGGAQSAPTIFHWGLTGQTTNVDHLLMHKANGTLVIPLWIEAASFDANANGGSGALVSVPAQTVTVNLAKNTGSGVVWTCNPATGAWSSRPVTITNGTLSLNVTDTVSILEVAP